MEHKPSVKFFSVFKKELFSLELHWDMKRSKDGVGCLCVRRGIVRP